MATKHIATISNIPDTLGEDIQAMREFVWNSATSAHETYKTEVYDPMKASGKLVDMVHELVSPNSYMVTKTFNSEASLNEYLTAPAQIAKTAAYEEAGLQVIVRTE